MNRLIEATRLALRSLGSYRLRAFLTLLGITVGIYAISIVFTLVYSMEHSVGRNLASLGNTALFVHNWPWKDNSEDWHVYYNRPKVSWRDFETLKQRLKQVEGVAFTATRRGATLRVSDRTVEQMSIRGVTYDFLAVNNLGFEQGRFFSPFEVSAGRNYCILGSRLARQLFDGGPYLNRSVNVAGRRLKVIGVLDKQGKNLFGENQDDFFIVPWPVFTRMFRASERRIDKVVSIRAASYEVVPQVEDQITALVRQARGLRPSVPDNFSINKQEALMEQLSKLFRYLNLGGSLISAISLIIGGFGIANIMYVSVRERTREIGVQKSLGATRSFILLQFLIEAVALCVLGGLLGLALTGLTALGVGALVSRLDIGFEVVMSVSDLALSLGLSVAVGLVSGLLPALSASRLSPVEALRAR